MFQKLSLSLLMIISVVSIPIYAQNISSDSLARMSFMDLINVKVTVASRQEESIFEAPGMVTNYSAKEIKELGYYTIGELADITPGFSTTHLFGEQGLETRGGSPTAFNNNRHIILVDGININHARANKAPTQEEVPLLFADKIEFLRGPSATIYGNGAVYGVINIVPLIPTIDGTIFKSRLSISTTDNGRQISSSVSHRDSKVTYSAAASYHLKEASQAFVGPTENDNHLYWDDRRSIFIFGQFELQDGPLKGFGIGTSYISRNSGLGEHWAGNYSHELNDILWVTFVGYLKYRKELTDQLSLNSAFVYNRSIEEGTYISEHLIDTASHTDQLISFYKVPVKNASLEADLSWTNPIVDVSVGFKLDWRQQTGAEAGGYGYIIGKTAPHLSTEQSLFSSSVSYHTASLYGQIKKEVPLLSGLILSAGVRGDFGHAGSESYQNAAPQVAIIQKFTDNLNLKLLWGTAFAAPVLKEMELNNESRFQNPDVAAQIEDLSPEDFSNYEVGIVYHPSFSIGHHDFSLTLEASGFYNESTNQIKFSRLYSPTLGDSVNYYQNSGSITHSSGLESQIKLVSSFGVSLFSNYSFAFAYNADGTPVTDIPRHRYEAGVAGTSEKTGIYGSVVGRFISGYSTPLNNSNYPGTTFLDGLLGWKTPLYIGFEVQIKNIFDALYYTPLSNVRNTPLPPRTFVFTVTADF